AAFTRPPFIHAASAKSSAPTSPNLPRFFIALVFFITLLRRPDSHSWPSTVERTADSFLHSFYGIAFWRIVRAWEWGQPNPQPAQRRLGFRTASARQVASPIAVSTAHWQPSF